MEHGIWRRVCLVATVAATLWGMAPQEAEANANFFQLWQTRGGDASRDGHVGGGNIVRNPRVVVRVNTASSDESASAALGDVDGDGVAEEVGLDNGAVVALREDLSTLWETAPLGMRRLEAVRDLDGDGAAEVLASSQGQLHILQGSDGAVAFSLGLDAGDEVLLRDIDGDGQPEVMVRGTQPQPSLRAYRYDGGQGTLLWQLMEGLPEGGFDFTVGDADGQSPWEVIVDDHDGGRVLVWNAATGESLRQRQERTLFGEGGCGPSWLANVDQDPQAEVFLTSTRRTQETGSVYVAAYDYVEDSVAWSYEFGARGIGGQAMDVPWRPVRDLDGDGQPEILLSIFNNTREIEADGQAVDQDGLDVPGNWLTVAYNAANGELISAINGRRLVGVVDLPGQNPLVLLKLGGGVEEMPVTRQLLEAVQLVDGNWRTLWRMPVATALTAQASDTSCAGPGQGALPRLLTTDTDGDGAPELAVVRYLDEDELPDVIQTVSLSTDVPRVVGERLLESVSVQGVGLGAGVLGPEAPHMEVRLGDGYLTALDRELGSARRAALGHGVATLRGLKIDINNSAEYHLRVQAPLGPLRVLDPAARDGASAAQLWEAPEGAWTPDLVFVDPDTDHSLMPIGRMEGQTPMLEAYNNLGELVWSQALDSQGSWPTEMIYAHVGGLEHEDLVYLLETPNGAMLEARDGVSGELLRSVPLALLPGASLSSRLLRIPGDEAEDFRDQNETDDLVLLNEMDALVMDGDTFTVVRPLSTGPQAFLSALVDIDGDDSLDILVQSPDGTRSARRLDNDELLWTLPLEPSYMGSPQTFPGLVQFINTQDDTSGARVALGGAFGDLTLYSHNTGERLWSVCLMDGEVTPIPMGVALNEQACGGAPMADLTTARPGFGNEDQILVGSRDGWVYVIRSQDGAVEWKLPLHRPLGPVVVADGDGDRNSELVVAADNGSFYAFKGRFDPVRSVRDVVLGAEDVATNLDVDQSQQSQARGLAFAWDSVLGADVYHVGVLGDDEFVQPLTEGSNASNFVFLAEPGQLKPGVTYRAVVQAQSASGLLSPVTLSDGVTIVDDQAPSVALSLLGEGLLSPGQGQSARFSLEASDNMGLRQVTVTATLEGAQEPAWIRTWPLRYAPALMEQFTWSGLDEQGAPLPDGAYTLRAVAVDYGDLSAEATATVSLDSTGPEAPAWTAPMDQATLAEARPTLAGTAEAGARVVVTLDEVMFCEVTADQSGVFSCAAQEDLAQGEHSATAQAFDALDNPGATSQALTFSLDLTAPEVPSVVAPTQGQVFMVDAPEPVDLAVQAEAGSVVTVFLGEQEVCEISEADGEDAGRYTCQSAALEPGDYSVTAQATDAFGRSSELSTAVSFSVVMNQVEPDMGMDADMEDMGDPDMDPDMDDKDVVEPDMVEPDAGDDMGEPDSGAVPDVVEDMGEDASTVGVGSPANDDCGCAVPTKRAPVTPWLVSLSLGAALLWWRRRR